MNQTTWIDRTLDKGILVAVRTYGKGRETAADFVRTYSTARELGEGYLDAAKIAISREPRAEAQRGLIREVVYEANNRPKIRHETIIAPHDTNRKWEAVKESLGNYFLEGADSWYDHPLHKFMDWAVSGPRNVVYRWDEYSKRDKKERGEARRFRGEVLGRYKDKWAQLKKAEIVQKPEARRLVQNVGEEPRAFLREDIGEVYSELQRLRELYEGVKNPKFLGFTRAVRETALLERQRQTQEIEAGLREIGQYALDTGHAELIAQVEQVLGERYTDEQMFAAFRNHAFDTRGFAAGLAREEFEILTPEKRREEARKLQKSVEASQNGRRKEIADINQEGSFSALYERLFADDIDIYLFRLEESLELGIVNRVLTRIYGDAEEFLAATKLKPKDREGFLRAFEEARDFSAVDLVDYFDVEESPETLVRDGIVERYAPLLWPASVGLAGTNEKALDLKDQISEEVERYLFGDRPNGIRGLKDVLEQYRTAAVLNILGAPSLEEARQLIIRAKTDTLGKLSYFGVNKAHRIGGEVFIAADMLGRAAGEFYRDVYNGCLMEFTEGVVARMRAASNEYDGQLLRRFSTVLAGFEAARNTRFVKEQEPSKIDLVVRDAEQTAFDFGRGVLITHLGSAPEVFASPEAQRDYQTHMNFLNALVPSLNGQTALDLKRIDFAVRKRMTELTGI